MWLTEALSRGLQGRFGVPATPPPTPQHSQELPSRGRALTMSQNYDRLVSVVQAAREDVEKAEAGNKAATSRVRKAMQDIKNIAQDIRKEMLEVRDAGKSPS